jgi:tetratricopeptide (TPR) repeat protein
VENRSGIAHAKLTLSELLAHAGRSDEAAALADRAVTNSRILESPQRLAPALHVRALRSVTAGRHEAALVDFNESIALLEQYSLLTMIGATVVNRADVLVSLDRAEQAVTDLQGTLPQVDKGMNPAQSITARGTLGRALLHIGEPDQARAILKDGIQRFFAFADSLADAPQRANANIVAIPLSVLPLLELAEGRSAEAWRIVESGLARQLRRSLGSTEQIVSLEEFQATLSHLDASALIVGVNSSEGSPLLLIGPDSIQGTNLKLSAGISRDLSSTIDLIAADSAPTMLAAPLERLSEQVRAGLSELFRSEHHRLIVMSGGWGGFPFELLEDQDGQLLGDRYDISYAPSATVLISLEGRQRAGVGFLALADPVSAPQTLLAGTAVAMRAAAEPRPPLPQAREEAKHIAPRGGRIALGAEATLSLLLEAGGQASVLHLAMHARVDVQHPGASALLMSPDDAFAHGVLAADDIAAASMKADLVSLSGCSTVGGYRVLGEGTFGLVRAFLEAGARTVVASRWDVEDAAARRFMELFYAQLATGAARDDALATARRTMRDEGYGYRDRAAFALVGAVSGELPVLRSEDGRGMLPLALVLFALALLAGVLVWQSRARASRRS